jgi:hypothetical protein
MRHHHTGCESTRGNARTLIRVPLSSRARRDPSAGGHHQHVLDTLKQTGRLVMLTYSIMMILSNLLFQPCSKGRSTHWLLSENINDFWNGSQFDNCFQLFSYCDSSNKWITVNLRANVLDEMTGQYQSQKDYIAENISEHAHVTFPDEIQRVRHWPFLKSVYKFIQFALSCTHYENCYYVSLVSPH